MFLSDSLILLVMFLFIRFLIIRDSICCLWGDSDWVWCLNFFCEFLILVLMLVLRLVGVKVWFRVVFSVVLFSGFLSSEMVLCFCIVVMVSGMLVWLFM